MNRILSNLFEHKSLSRTEARDIMLNIADGRYNDNQLSAFMTVFLTIIFDLTEIGRAHV